MFSKMRKRKLLNLCYRQLQVENKDNPKYRVYSQDLVERYNKILRFYSGIFKLPPKVHKGDKDVMKVLKQ